MNTLEACEKLLGKCSHLFKWQVLGKKQQKRMAIKCGDFKIVQN